MNFIIPLTIALLVLSTIKSKQKTIKALKMAYKKLKKIIPLFLTMLILISVSLSLLPEEVITSVLDNESRLISMVLASGIGSITMMPGFVAFPLAGVLLQKGITYMVLSAFTTTLMMVGILTFPLERAYFGTKITILRNVVSFLIAIVVSIVVGLVYGEIL